MDFFIAYFALNLSVDAQIYINQDSLRGSITKERAWWDLQQHSLFFDVNPTTKSVATKYSIVLVIGQIHTGRRPFSK